MISAHREPERVGVSYGLRQCEVETMEVSLTLRVGGWILSFGSFGDKL